ADGAWDAVTLWNVIEHLPDPLAMLRRARQLLRPGGVLYMAVPLCDSWEARLFGRYWIGWELPRHFTLFDRPTLARLLNSAGFCMAASACINGRTYGFSASLRLLIEDRVRSFTWRRLGQAVTYSRPLALALAPYTAAAVLAQRCTVLTIAARLPDNTTSGIISDA
ncbi:MAG TPA: class I SAM-dependent methyltransferase, partial [Roseiflexaceae bacterium]|nr:class I SAM-dependent methyltransferase [Roseiflexaceae bacterium]